MHPRIVLDDEVLRRNAGAWRAHAGVPLWAVVKADGYGWGAERLVAALDAEVAGYFVADEAEALAIRSRTERTIALFGPAEPARIPDLLEAGIVPNVASLETLAAADAWARSRGRPARIRIGIVPAAGWSGLLEEQIGAFAADAASRAVEIDLWTHVTTPALEPAQRRRFDEARGVFRGAGARVIGSDIAGTFASAREGRSDQSRVRIGIGLFGARGDGNPALQLACAIAIEATVVDVLPSTAVAAAGYREPERFATPWLAVVRCGYADGLPARLAGSGQIVSVGMQYAVLARNERAEIGQSLRLLEPSSDLCAFLAHTGVSPHEFVVGCRGSKADSVRRAKR